MGLVVAFAFLYVMAHTGWLGFLAALVLVVLVEDSLTNIR